MAEVIRDDLLQQLSDLALQEQRSLNEVLEEMLNRYDKLIVVTESMSIEELPRNSLKRLAAAGREMPSFGASNDISERADEILRDEFADYLLQRMNRSNDETSSD